MIEKEVPSHNQKITLNEKPLVCTSIKKLSNWNEYIVCWGRLDDVLTDVTKVGKENEVRQRRYRQDCNTLIKETNCHNNGKQSLP